HVFGHRARHDAVADRSLTRQAVGMRQAAGLPVSPKNRDGAVVPRNRRKTASNRDSIPTGPRGRHGAHLNKSFLDDVEAPLLFCWRSDSRAVNFSSAAFRRRQVSVHVKEAIPMDAGETEQQKK